MEIEDNIPIEQKREMEAEAVEEHTGTAEIDIECCAVDEADAKLQFIQTISEMDQDELVEHYDDIEVNFDE